MKDKKQLLSDITMLQLAIEKFEHERFIFMCAIEAIKGTSQCLNCENMHALAQMELNNLKVKYADLVINET